MTTITRICSESVFERGGWGIHPCGRTAKFEVTLPNGKKQWTCGIHANSYKKQAEEDKKAAEERARFREAAEIAVALDDFGLAGKCSADGVLFSINDATSILTMLLRLRHLSPEETS